MVTPLFEASDDWQLQFDLKVECDGQSKNKPFPPHIVAASRRPCDAVGQAEGSCMGGAHFTKGGQLEEMALPKAREL